MLCKRCGEREAEGCILIDAGIPDRPPRTSPDERQQREEELSGLCQRCLLEVTFPPERIPFIQRFFLTFVGSSLGALWQPESPEATYALPEQLLARLRNET
jgi:hypothetical protein